MLPATASNPADRDVTFAEVVAIADPEEAILVQPQNGERLYLAEPADFQLWRPFSGHRVEMRVLPCPPKFQAVGGRQPLCVRSWRDAEASGELTEVGPEQNLLGTFADAVVPPGRKAAGESVLTFTSGSSTLPVGHAPGAVPRGKEVQIWARVIDVKRSYSAMVTGPRLWVVRVGNR